MQPRGKNTPGLIGSFFLLAVSLIISLAMAEWAVRWLRPQKLVRAYTAPDAELGNVNRPNQDFFDAHGLPHYSFHVRTNGLAMRMDDEVDPGREKIIVLGDSFTFGWGVEVEDSFVRILKSGIEASFGGLQLLNAGHGGYSTGHVLKTLKKYAEMIALSGAVYFMNYNDLRDNTNKNINYQVVSFVAGEDGSITLKDRKVYSPVKRFLLLHTPYGWLNQHSNLFVFVKKLVKGHPENQPREPAVQVDMEEIPVEEQLLMKKVSLAHLRRLADFCRGKNLPFLIVWVPAPSEIFESGNSFYRTFKEELVSDPEILSGGVNFYDPTGQFKLLSAAKKKSDLYFPDGHYTREGNTLYAGALRNTMFKFAGSIAAPD